MRILFDQGTPLPLRRFLAGHEVATAFKKGWAELTNGDLLRMAEAEFELLITTDQNWMVVGLPVAAYIREKQSVLLIHGLYHEGRFIWISQIRIVTRLGPHGVAQPPASSSNSK